MKERGTRIDRPVEFIVSETIVGLLRVYILSNDCTVTL